METEHEGPGGTYRGTGGQGEQGRGQREQGGGQGEQGGGQGEQVRGQGEQVLFHGHPSWLSMLDLQFRGLLAMIVAGVIAGLATAVAAGHVQAGWVVVAVVAVAVVVGVVGLVRRRATTYTISNQRLTIQKGLLSREVHETRLERVQNVGTHQSLLERLLGIGTVDFDTAGEAGFDFSFTGVSDPRTIVHTVHGALSNVTDEPL